MVTILLLCNLIFLAISICAYVNICNDLEWISLKELLEVAKDVFDDADSGVEAAMIVFAIFLLPSILISCCLYALFIKPFLNNPLGIYYICVVMNKPKGGINNEQQ